MSDRIGGVIDMLHRRVVELRKAKKITQEILAKQIGVTRSALSQYELGVRQPDYDTVKKMADYFGVSTDYLLGREEKEGFSEGLTNRIIQGFVDEYKLDLSIPGEKERLEQFIKLYSQTRQK